LVKHDFKLGHLPLRIIIWKELYNDTTLKDQNLIAHYKRGRERLSDRKAVAWSFVYELGRWRTDWPV